MKSLPCGKIAGKSNELSISCPIIGCKNCKYFDGTEYVDKDIKRGVRNWMKLNPISKLLGHKNG